jgi:thiol-disulfide isomerase/thioredoxin
MHKILIITAVILLAALPAAAGPVGSSLPTVDGGKLSLSEFRGRVVVLDFFATWCGPCRAAMPKLEELHQQYQDQGLSVIGYSVDKGGRAAVKRFISKLGVTFPVVLGSVEAAQELAPVRYLPTTLVIDPQGKIIQRFVGAASERKLMQVVRPHLQGNAPEEPASAKGWRRQPGERRFQRVWVRDKQIVGGKSGVVVHVLADVADLPAPQGLWLALHLRPEATAGASLAPVGAAKTLYQRVDDPSRLHHLMFVRCDQFPPAPSGGVYRAWVSVLDQRQRPVEQSGHFIIHSTPGCQTASAR